ncbi:MAG: hypothetical protein AAFY11_14165, partial [Cyanobacteria bacterium J06641_5]
QAQAAEVRRQQEAAQAQAAEARRQQELAQAQTAEVRRQQELARAQEAAQQQQATQRLGSSAPAAPAQVQQSAASSPTADPFLSSSIAARLAPPTTAAPTQIAAAPSTPSITVPSAENSYGFRNVTVSAPRVAISLRDNVDEDGDVVTLRVNGQEYATNLQIRNSGKVIFVPLNPGENLVEIVAVRDGQGGITLEAGVAGVGNINEDPIPEGRTASFVINYEE